MLPSFGTDPIKHRNNREMTHAERWMLAVNPGFYNVLSLSSFFIAVTVRVWPRVFHHCLMFATDSLSSSCAAVIPFSPERT